MPKEAATMFQALNIKNPVMADPPQGFTQGFTLTGTAKWGTSDVAVRVVVVDDPKGGRGISVAIGTPSGWKVSDMFPNLTAIDGFPLPSITLIASNFEYADAEYGELEIGLNLVSKLAIPEPPRIDFSSVAQVEKSMKAVENYIEKTGPLALVGLLRIAAQVLKPPFVFEKGDIIFKGILRPYIINSEFDFTVPLRLGVDFTLIKDVPKSLTDVVKKIVTDDITYSITLTSGLAPEIEVRTGIEITLGTQRQPLKFDVAGSFEGPVVSLAGIMGGMLKVTDWLSFGEAGIEIKIDPAVLPIAILLGIPFTGIGFRGAMTFGATKGAKQAKIDLAALVSVEVSGALPEIAFVGKAKDLNFSQLIQWFTKVTGKELPIGKIPTFALKDLEMYVVPLPTQIADKNYEAGLTLDADVNILGLDAGMFLNVNPVKFQMMADGHLSKIDLKVGGKSIFRFGGTGSKGKYGPKGITRNGPEIELKASIAEPEKSGLMLTGKIEIPPLGIVQATGVQIGATGFRFDFETKLGNLFDLDTTADLNFTKPERSAFKFKFKQDLIDLITKSVRGELGGEENARGIAG